MAQPHTASGEIVSVRPLDDQLSGARTTALLKSDQLEIVRIVLLAGQSMREHQAPGEITVQCLEGEVAFSVRGVDRLLRGGDLIHLRGRERHALKATSDSSLLVTMCLVPAT